MRRLLQHLLPLALGSALGFGVMALLPVTLHAQTPGHFHADAANNCQWTQPASTLTQAQTMRVTASVNGQTAVTVAQTCNGTVSPFTCQFPVPLALQPVGLDTLVVNGANVDPVDGSLSSFIQLTSVTFTIDPPLTPPQPGGPGKIIRIVGGLVLAGFITLFSLFGHH